MVRALCAFLLFAVPGASPGVPRTNFLYITVSAKQPTPVHAIWRPYAGAIGDGYAQQEAVMRMRTVPNVQDSTRRWRDSTVRDTIMARTPVGFTVDMNGGPIVIEAAGNDSIRVEAQLTPSRGPIVAVWGRVFVVSADGVAPRVERRRYVSGLTSACCGRPRR